MPGVLESGAADGRRATGASPRCRPTTAPAVAPRTAAAAQVVLKQSKNPALAAGFLKWLNNGPDGVKIFLETRRIPRRPRPTSSPTSSSPGSEYFGGQKINEVLVRRPRRTSSTGWQYLPFQVYANSIFGDTVGQAYAQHAT